MARITQITKAATLSTLLLAACGTEAGKEGERVNEQVSENRQEMAQADDSQEWMEERKEAVRELTELRDNMDARLVREQKRRDDGIKDAERRRECEKHIQELQANIARIDYQLTLLNAGTATDWDRLKMETRAMADSTGNWFKREAEKIDRATKADADDDGH